MYPHSLQTSFTPHTCLKKPRYVPDPRRYHYRSTYLRTEPFRLPHWSSCSEPYESSHVHFSDTTENKRFKGSAILQRRNFTWTDVSDIHEQERGMFLANTGSVWSTKNTGYRRTACSMLSSPLSTRLLSDQRLPAVAFCLQCCPAATNRIGSAPIATSL